MFLGLWRGVHPQRLPSCLQGRLLRECTEAACILEKMGNRKHVHFHESWGRLRGERLSYLSIYLFYIVFLSFSQKFSRLLTLAGLRFMVNGHSPPSLPDKSPRFGDLLSQPRTIAPPICFRLLDVQFRCTFLKVLKTEHKFYSHSILVQKTSPPRGSGRHNPATLNMPLFS